MKKFISIDNKDNNQNEQNIFIYEPKNSINYFQTEIINNSDSTLDKSNITYSNYYNLNYLQLNEYNSAVNNNNEKKFNSARANYCLKYKLFNISLKSENIEFNHPSKYKINDQYYAYVYPNDLVTYTYTIAGFLSKNNTYIESNNNIKENNGSYYEETLGLYFCGKNIQINKDNKNIYKKCSPNDFICKKCMILNKKLYKLKKCYLINIIGRVSKKNKGSYHCFGNFSIGNQLETCLSKFTCKACQQLNTFSEFLI